MIGRPIGGSVAPALGALFAAGCMAFIAGCGGHDQAHSTGGGQGSASADAAFVAGMIPHHEGAIEMARMAKDRSQRTEIRGMADSIIASQQSEIDRMAGMKRRLGAPAAHGDGHSAAGMTDHEMGMDGDMSDLRRAKDFDRAFLEMMIPHHEGALRMSDRVIADGRDPEVRRLARSIRQAQATEIAQMKTWLSDWYGSGQVGPGKGPPGAANLVPPVGPGPEHLPVIASGFDGGAGIAYLRRNVFGSPSALRFVNWS